MTTWATAGEGMGRVDKARASMSGPGPSGPLPRVLVTFLPPSTARGHSEPIDVGPGWERRASTSPPPSPSPTTNPHATSAPTPVRTWHALPSHGNVASFINRAVAVTVASAPWVGLDTWGGARHPPLSPAGPADDAAARRAHGARTAWTAWLHGALLPASHSVRLIREGDELVVTPSSTAPPTAEGVPPPSMPSTQGVEEHIGAGAPHTRTRRGKRAGRKHGGGGDDVACAETTATQAGVKRPRPTRSAEEAVSSNGGWTPVPLDVTALQPCRDGPIRVEWVRLDGERGTPMTMGPWVGTLVRAYQAPDGQVDDDGVPVHGPCICVRWPCGGTAGADVEEGRTHPHPKRARGSAPSHRPSRAQSTIQLSLVSSLCVPARGEVPIHTSAVVASASPQPPVEVGLTHDSSGYVPTSPPVPATSTSQVPPSAVLDGGGHATPSVTVVAMASTIPPVDAKPVPRRNSVRGVATMLRQLVAAGPGVTAPAATPSTAT